jgi:hypothetical protein
MPAEYPGHAVSATVVRPGAVARRDRRRAGNLALAGNAGPRTVNL